MLRLHPDWLSTAIEGSAPIEEEAHRRLSAEIAKRHNNEIEKLNKEVLNEKQ